MKQMTLAAAGFERYAKTTRRAVFLAEMERVVPWPALCGLIEPFYPKAGNGRPPVGVERMLRIYFLQQWFNLSDPAVEEVLYDSLAMRDFVGVDLGREPVPDETTVCRFRHLLETHDLGQQLFDEVQRHLTATGLKVATGTIVDATIISAPSSTKNAKKARDPEMHQTKKGNQWYFGMKAHFGVDSHSKLIHALVTTPAMRIFHLPVDLYATLNSPRRPYEPPNRSSGPPTPTASNRGCESWVSSDAVRPRGSTNRAGLRHARPWNGTECVRRFCHNSVGDGLSRLPSHTKSPIDSPG